MSSASETIPEPMTWRHDVHRGRPVDPVYAERGAALMAEWATETPEGRSWLTKETP